MNNTTIDFESLVPVEEAQASTDSAQPGNGFVSHAIDYNSLSLDPPQSPRPSLYQTGTALLAGPAAGFIPRVIDDLSKVNYRLTPDEARPQIVKSISNVTGLAEPEIDKYYSPIRLLMDSMTAGPAGAAKDISPVTTEGIVSATMTPAIVTAAAADLPGTAAGLLVYTALDHIIPTPKIQNATPDVQSSVNLIGMIAKGALTGGLIHGAGELKGKVQSEWLPDVLEKFGYGKLKENGLPNVLEVKPEQLTKLGANATSLGIDPKEMDTAIANNLSVKVPVEKLLRVAINSPEDFQSVSDVLGGKPEIPVSTDVPKFTMPPLKTTEDAISLGDQVSREKNAPIIIEEMKKMYQDVLAQNKELKGTENVDQRLANAYKGQLIREAFERAESIVTGKEVGSSGPPPVKAEAIPGTGETKTRGLSLGVEEKAIANKLEVSFGEFPEYKTVNMEEQAKYASELMNNDPVLARKIAMGEETPPKGIIPESVFVAVENKAIAEGDVNTLRDLATKSNLTTEATTMGQRIATLATRDPESPTGAIKDVLKAREERAQKSLGEKNIEQAKSDIVKEIKAEIKKPKVTKQDWAGFIKSLEC